MEAILTAGAKLANLAFNLAQSGALPAEVRASLDECRKEWDAAVRAGPLEGAAPADKGGDTWITAKVARHLDLQYSAGAAAGWNAGVVGDHVALARLRGRAATKAEYATVFPDLTPAPTSWCHTCRPVTMLESRMVLCPTCGNKRCPRANDHRHDCTGSNEPGQPGSACPATASNLESPP